MITIHFSALFDSEDRYHGEKVYTIAGIGHILANVKSVVDDMRRLLVEKCTEWNLDPKVVTKIDIYYYDEIGEKIIFQWSK